MARAAGHREGDHRFSFAFQLKVAGLAPIKTVGNLSLGYLRDEDSLTGRGGFESRCRIDCVSDYAVFDPVPGADPTRHDFARVNANPHREAVDAPASPDLVRVFASGHHDLESRPNRPLRVVLVGNRCTEEGK